MVHFFRSVCQVEQTCIYAQSWVIAAVNNDSAGHLRGVRAPYLMS
jgi:hypothetical protein